MKLWEKYSKDEIQQMVKDSRSYRQLASRIGYSQTGGGSIASIKKMIEELNLDISHFIGQGWNKDNFDYSRFQNGNIIGRGKAIDALINLRGRTCERCHLDSWMEQDIPLEVHHIDGNNLNNNFENLLLLCPNCHAQTDNFRGKNIKKETQKISEEELKEALEEASSIRQALIKVGLTPKGGNYSRAYDIIYKYNIKKFIN